MVIELETACGCKQLREISDERPPRHYTVGLRRPSPNPLDLGDEPIWTAKIPYRRFEFRDADHTPTGIIYRYREVI